MTRSSAQPRFLRLLTAFVLAMLAGGASAELPRVQLDTPVGAIVLEIDTEAAPITGAHFLALVDDGVFDAGASFYRVVTLENQPTSPVKIEVIQGGLGSAREPVVPMVAHEDTRQTGLRHTDGALSMARLAPGSASSEFFICVGDQPELDHGGRRNPDGQGFAAFGRVVEGMAVVRAIQGQRTRPAPEGAEDFDGQQLLRPVTISSLRRLP